MNRKKHQGLQATGKPKRRDIFRTSNLLEAFIRDFCSKFGEKHSIFTKLLNFTLNKNVEKYRVPGRSGPQKDTFQQKTMIFSKKAIDSVVTAYLTICIGGMATT